MLTGRTVLTGRTRKLSPIRLIFDEPLELGQYGITANAIGPGPIRTELFDKANPADSPRTQAIINAIPVRRVGDPEDVANAVAFLLDARSGFITGQVLYVCGGMTVGSTGA